MHAERRGGARRATLRASLRGSGHVASVGLGHPATCAVSSVGRFVRRSVWSVGRRLAPGRLFVNYEPGQLFGRALRADAAAVSHRLVS